MSTETSPPASSRGAPVLIERQGAVTLLRINRPESRNALTGEIRDALGAAVTEFFSDDDARCLVLTGVDNAFCAGGDLKNFRQRQTWQEAYDRIRNLSHGWVSLLLTGAKPVIAAVNGPAVGAGFGLAMLADLVMVSDEAFFQPGFTAVGLVPDYGLGQILPRLMGPMRTKKLIFNNERLSAADATDLGLAIAVYPTEDLLPAALDQARRLAAGPTKALALSKALIDGGRHLTAADYLDLEARSQAEAFASDDHAEGVAAFIQRRKPRFAGK